MGFGEGGADYCAADGVVLGRGRGVGGWWEVCGEGEGGVSEEGRGGAVWWMGWDGSWWMGGLGGGRGGKGRNVPGFLRDRSSISVSKTPARMMLRWRVK